MSVTPKTNQRYLTGNNQSIHSLKLNTNEFLKDFSVLEQKNRIDNGYFNSVYTFSGMPGYWETSGVNTFSYDSVNRTSFTNVASGGYFRQAIQQLKPNETYTAIVFCTTPAASAFKVSVYNAASGQIANVNDSTQLNQAFDYVAYSASTSAVLQKTIVQFSTHSTTVSGTAYIELKNASSASQTIELKKIIVYKGLVELDDVMDSNSIPPANTRSLLLEDQVTWDTYEYFIYKGSLVQRWVDPPSWQKVSKVIIKDSASAASYTMRSISGTRVIDQDHTYNSTAPTAVNIDDIANGIKYNFSVSSGTGYFTVASYNASDYVLADRVTPANKFFIEVNASGTPFLQVVATSASCSGTSASGFPLRDTVTEQNYSLCVSGGNIVAATAGPYDQSLAFHKDVKDYATNDWYRIYIESGVVKLYFLGAEGYTLLKEFRSFTGPSFGQTVIDRVNSVSGTPVLDVDAAMLDGQHGSYYAPITSPAFSGVPTAPTAAAGTNTTQVATTEFVTSSPSLSGTPTAPTAATGTATNQIATTAFVTNSVSLSGVPTAPTAPSGTNTNQIATCAFVIAKTAPLEVPDGVGEVKAFAGSAAPVKHLFCDGAQYDGANPEYAALYAVIGKIYGGGAGSLFNVPDLRGEFIRGKDGGRGIDPSGDRDLGNVQGDAFEDHVHPQVTNATDIDSGWGNKEGTGAVGNNYFVGSRQGPNTLGALVGTAASETRPRNVALHYIIRYK